MLKPGSASESVQASLGPFDLAGAPAVRRAAAYLELTKPRITFLILLVSLAALWLGSAGNAGLPRLLTLSAAICLLAGGMFAVNQFQEREIDARMRRTENRPLPAGRLQPREALWFGLALAGAALALLALAVNLLTALLGALTLASYLLVYTPLKKITPHCTLLGAFPGAAPPLLGWTAARGELSAEAWILFSILFLWQFPHFHAIACLYRDEYSRAGVRLWPVVEPSGRTAARQIVGAAALLVPVTLLPSAVGLSGNVYLAGAGALGLLFLSLSVRSAWEKSARRAQELLLASVVYLPLLLALMVLDSGGTR
jgi:protoheme IX farnesyltransferase